MPDLLELAVAMATHTRDTEKAVQEAISRAMLQLGDTELRPRQDLTIRRFLQRKGVFFCFPNITGKLLAWLTASSICHTSFSKFVGFSSRLSMDDKHENGGTAKSQLLRPSCSSQTTYFSRGRTCGLAELYCFLRTAVRTGGHRRHTDII